MEVNFKKILLMPTTRQWIEHTVHNIMVGVDQIKCSIKKVVPWSCHKRKKKHINKKIDWIWFLSNKGIEELIKLLSSCVSLSKNVLSPRFIPNQKRSYKGASINKKLTGISVSNAASWWKLILNLFFFASI